MKLRALVLGAAIALAAVVAASAAARPAAAPTIAIAPGGSISFGRSVTIHGVVPGAPAGSTVQILMQPCGFTDPVPSGTVRTTAGGKYSYVVEPMLNSRFFAQVGDATSGAGAVRVAPTVQLRKISAHLFGIDVSAGNGSWFTKTVSLQRFDPRAKTWRPVATAPLKANSDPGALVAVSSAALHAVVKAGTQLRAVLSQGTVGSCFLPATSPSIAA
jgi:hypothetical protein